MIAALEKPFTCNIDGCGKAFTSKKGKEDHRVNQHGRPRKARRHHNHSNRQRPFAGFDRDEVYAMVEAMDLPDGAHWAMIEELSGYEPGDFA